MLHLVSLVLNTVFLVVVLTTLFSRSIKVAIVKIVLIVGLLTVQILLGNLVISLVWGLLLILNVVFLLDCTLDASRTTENQQEAIGKEDNYCRCAHCGTGSDTSRGNCKKCGAPLSS